MKVVAQLLVFLLLASTALASGWKLVWSDEFDKTGPPDPAKWGCENGFIRNDEAQYYTRERPENARVEDGSLVIEARKERFRNPLSDPAGTKSGDWNHRHMFAGYTSASLTTQGKASWTYGRIEVRAKLPAGRGVWPAIWTMGTNITDVDWPRCGEIDIMENVGFEPGIINVNVHALKVQHYEGNTIKIPDASNAFHVYALEWGADQMDFFRGR